jgi:hypothetical protein
MDGLGKKLLEGFLPEGAVWTFRKNGDMDRLLDGVGASLDALIAKCAETAHARNPRRAPAELLPDLAAEFGARLSGDAGADRNRIAEIRYNDWIGGFVVKLQQRLDAGGFGSDGYGLRVVPNAPFPARPTLQTQFQATAGDKILIPGAATQIYLTTAGSRATATAKPATHYTGYYFLDKNHCYAIDEMPTPPQETWGLVFFLGGSVQRNPAGRITSVAKIPIPTALKDSLYTIIMQIKPLFAWAFLCVDWT